MVRGRWEAEGERSRVEKCVSEFRALYREVRNRLKEETWVKNSAPILKLAGALLVRVKKELPDSAYSATLKVLKDCLEKFNKLPRGDQ